MTVGRTNPTFRDALRAIEERWGTYRRALRQHDQPRFDRLFAYAREHADASGLLNHSNPLLAILFSVDLEQEARLDDHDTRLDDHDARLAELEAAIESPRPDGEGAANENAACVESTGTDGDRRPHERPTDTTGH